MTALQFPFLDLFQALQARGMTLSPDQYDLLRQALAEGFGLESGATGNWEDLRQLCRVLWVKPHLNYDGQIFETTFDQYAAQKQRERRAHQVDLTPIQPAPHQLGPLPRVPPRRLAAHPPEAVSQAPTAVKTGPLSYLPPVDTTGFHLWPRDLPLSLSTVLDSWWFLRRPLRAGTRQELDLEATVEQIGRQGRFSDVVMRPQTSKQAELVLLVDDSNVMVPYQPALHPLVEAITSRRMTPATLYRFRTYPDEYLYDWQSPSLAVPLTRVLSRMHARRTIVWVWSHAGAAQANPLPDHRQGLLTFLTRLTPCLRCLVWLNPLPPHRWPGTLAAEVARLLDGRMIHADRSALLTLARQPINRDRQTLRGLG